MLIRILPLLFVFACSQVNFRYPASDELVWSEEFNTDGKPDEKIWDYDADYLRNHEAQCYTTEREENVRVSGGHLVLEARKENYKCPIPGVNQKIFPYTSGAIRTRKRNAGPVLKDMSFGRYEIRAKIPVTRGIWPAIWIVGIAPGLHWPQAGEIDIMELVGFEHAEGLHRIHSTLHKDPDGAPWPLPNRSIFMGHVLDFQENLDEDFHVFRLDWSPTKLEFFVDGKRVNQRLVGNQIKVKNGFSKSEINAQTPKDWPYERKIPGQQFFMILNLAVGGDWGGKKGIDDSQFERGPVEMLVDYVRVYRLPEN